MCTYSCKFLKLAYFTYNFYDFLWCLSLSIMWHYNIVILEVHTFLFWAAERFVGVGGGGVEVGRNHQSFDGYGKWDFLGGRVAEAQVQGPLADAAS